MITWDWNVLNSIAYCIGYAVLILGAGWGLGKIISAIRAWK